MDCRYVSGEKGYTDSVDMIVVGMCQDYERRREILSLGYASRRVELEFKYLNFKINEAVMEIVDERLALPYIKEIGGRIGYAKSEIDCVSESTYKIQKKEIKINIARKLHLID